jgi:hypothetical protein
VAGAAALKNPLPLLALPVGALRDRGKRRDQTEQNTLRKVSHLFETPASRVLRFEAAGETPAPRYFDEMAADAGWDVRDPRGRSARVFAPGSRQRYRRPKEWHERKENRDKLAAAAVLAAGVGGLALGTKLGRRLGAKKVPAPVLAKGYGYGPRSGVRPEGFRARGR